MKNYLAVMVHKVRKLARKFNAGKCFGYGWALLSVISSVLIYKLDFSLGLLTVEYTMATSSVLFVVLCWIINGTLFKHFGRGMTAYYGKLFERPLTEEQLIEKLKTTKETVATYATIGVMAIAILISAITIRPLIPPHSIIIVLVAFLLLSGVVILINATDLYDTSTTPNIPKNHRLILWGKGTNSYIFGFCSIIASILLGVALINPYITVAISPLYIIVCTYYYYMFD